MEFAFPHRLGLDPKLLAKILNMSSGRCWSSDTYNPVPGVMEGVPSGNNYQGGFGTQLMAKVSLTTHRTILCYFPDPANTFNISVTMTFHLKVFTSQISSNTLYVCLNKCIASFNLCR